MFEMRTYNQMHYAFEFIHKRWNFYELLFFDIEFNVENGTGRLVFRVTLYILWKMKYTYFFEFVNF